MTASAVRNLLLILCSDKKNPYSVFQQQLIYKWYVCCCAVSIICINSRYFVRSFFFLGLREFLCFFPLSLLYTLTEKYIF